MATSHQYRPRTTGNAANDEALRVAFNFIYQLQNQIASITTVQSVSLPNTAEPVASGGGGSSSVPSIATITETLSGGGTVSIVAAAPTGANMILFVILTENSSGGTTISWGSTFSTNTPTSINNLPNAVTVFCFISNGSIWQYAALAA